MMLRAHNSILKCLLFSVEYFEQNYCIYINWCMSFSLQIPIPSQLVVEYKLLWEQLLALLPDYAWPGL
jgi:hypothetical protein